MGSWQLPISDSQKSDLDRALVEYVRWNCEQQQPPSSSNANDLVRSLCKVLNVDVDVEVEVEPQRALLLPRKWNSIARLQRRIMVLEQACKDLDTQLQEAKARDDDDGTPVDVTDWVPRQIPNYQITVDSTISAIRLHPQFPIVFVGTDYGKLFAFDLLNYSIPLLSIQAHTKAITAIDVLFLDKDVQTFVSTSSKDQQVRIFRDASSSNASSRSTSTDASQGLALELHRSFVGHEHMVSDVKIWQNQSEILAASCSRDRSIKIWDVINGWSLKTFQPHSDWIRTFDILGEYILSGSQDTGLRLTHWPSGNGLCIGSGHDFPIESVRFIPLIGGSQLRYRHASEEEYEKMGFEFCVSASRDRTIKIWHIPLPRFIPHRPPVPNVSNSNMKCCLTLHGHQSWVRDVHVRGIHLFSCGDDKTVRCWDLETGQCLKIWENIHSGFINCMDLDSDTSLLKRKILVTGGLDCRSDIFMK